MAGGIDHLVVVAQDLDALADLYRRMGFQVGARNRHEWGTLNNIVQFDGAFLELLTTESGFQAPPPASPLSSFAGTIVDYLSKREGVAMMVLEAVDAKADHASFNAAGIGLPETFWFGREGKRPDGSPVEVSFSLAFARSPAIQDAGFFVCQQHAPDMFWNPSFQVHENGVTGINRLVFAAGNPTEHANFFQKYTGVAPESGDGSVVFGTARGEIELTTRQELASRWGDASLPAALDTARFAAVVFAAPDVSRVADHLSQGGIAFDRTGDRVVVPASAAKGATLVFEPA